MLKEKADYKLNRYPNLICPGAQKAGTTTLFNLLLQHPDITGLEYKEIQFFDKYYHKGINWYMKKCRGSSSSRYIMDFTPGYMTEEIYIKRMKEVLDDDVKFIILLRNPVERMYSHYIMNLRIGLETEADAMKAFNKDYRDYLSGDKTAKYFRYSMYSEQVMFFKKMFSDENIKIILFEDMVSNTEGVMAEVFNYLNLDVPDKMNYEVWKNKVGSITMPRAIRVLRRVFERGLGIMRILIPYKLMNVLKRAFLKMGKKSVSSTHIEKDTEVCRVLMDRCMDDIEKLEEILGKKLDIWANKYIINNI